MDAVTALLLLVVIAAFTFLVRRRWAEPRDRKPLPPQAPGLPVIGNLLNFLPRNGFAFMEAYTTLGDVYMTRIGPVQSLMLNSYRAVHEAFVQQADTFTGRRKGAFVEALVHNSGVASIDGPKWQEQRRFMLRVLREFGLGRPQLASIVGEECAALKERLAQADGEPQDTQELFSVVTNNVIARLTFGERCGTDDADFRTFTHHLEGTLKLRPILVLALICPWIVKVPPLLRLFDRYARIFHHMEGIHDYIRAKLHRQAALFKAMEAPPTELHQATNICEAYLIEQARQEAASPGRHTFDEWQLVRSLADLFAGGTETTASALNWAMLLLALNPDVQQRARREIEEQVGRERAPVMADKPRLPYVSAVLDEAMRLASLTPFNIPHRALADTELMGYRVPANITVHCNLYGIHHDPRLWAHPDAMYPEHFLTADGEYRPSKFLIPFSLGKRACPGESLARTEYFLVLVTVLQSFRVALADPNADGNELLKATRGIIRHPAPHQVCFTRLEQ